MVIGYLFYWRTGLWILTRILVTALLPDRFRFSRWGIIFNGSYLLSRAFASRQAGHGFQYVPIDGYDWYSGCLHHQLVI